MDKGKYALSLVFAVAVFAVVGFFVATFVTSGKAWEYDYSEPVQVTEDGETAPELEGINTWLNAAPLKIADLRGKVVLLDFFTYGCPNCVRTFPHLKALYDSYTDDGLVVLGVHTPEYSFEKVLENVQQAIEVHEITWPVALDNDYATWDAYGNQSWPSQYLMDVEGVIRYTHVGDGGYMEIEEKVRELLLEAGADLPQMGFVHPSELLAPGPS